MKKSYESTEVVSMKKAQLIYDNWDKLEIKGDITERNKLRDYINSGRIGEEKVKIPVVYHYADGKRGKGRQYVYGNGFGKKWVFHLKIQKYMSN